MGLRVAPVIPEAWSGFSARRVFREVTYHITVERRSSGNTISLWVNGKSIEGDIVPFPPEGSESVQVKGVLG
jgi:cellobiose phosphorylase